MFNSSPSQPSVLKIAVVATFIAALAVSPLALAQEHEHGKQDLTAAAEKTVTGEVVDMMCYVDHNAVGEKHGQSCGAKCIKSGGPVGVVENGKAYLVVGEHKPMNDQLAEYLRQNSDAKRQNRRARRHRDARERRDREEMTSAQPLIILSGA